MSSGITVPYSLEWQRVASLVVAVAIAVVATGIFAFRPHAAANRRIALVLAAQATGLAAGWSVGMMATDPAVAARWITAAWIAYVALVPLYLLFLATLSTPLVRPLDSTSGNRLLWILVLLAPIVVLLRTDWFFVDLTPREGRSTFVQMAGPLGAVLPAIHALPLPLYGLVAAIDQWRRAPVASLGRRQAGAYALAFGWRDMSWAVLLLVLPAATGMSITDSDALPTLFYAVMELGFMLLVVYGILSTQLFDVDVRARLVIGQSTVAAVAAGLFFLLSELTEQLMSFEGLLPALLWASIIALVFRPLQNLGRRIALRVIPVRAGHDDRERRLQLYEEAVKGFEADGTITHREAAILRRLRERLDLADTDLVGPDVEP